MWKPLKKVLPLLKSYVNAEIIALGNDTDNCQTENRRRVIFSAFDFSSVKTPVDMITTSNSHIELSINALETILDEVKALVKKGRKESSDIAKVFLALDAIASTDGISKRIALAEVKCVVFAHPLQYSCFYKKKLSDSLILSKTMMQTMPVMEDFGPSWPPSRFVQAAGMYRDELEAILAEMEAPKDGQAYFPTTTKQRLSFHIFSNIRFHLRRLLDVPPSGFTLHHDGKPSNDYAKCRAQTYKLVGMHQPEHEKSKYCRDQKLWETSLSYVFNVALRYIYRYFISTESIKAGIDAQNVSQQATSYMIDHDSFSPFDNSLGLFEHNMDEVVADIQGARLLFGTLGAARFV